MKVLVFDLKGKFAHFRKFHANSSSLSYKVPPRTVISGLIAAILGYERDSYYEIFDLDKANIAVQILEKPRVVMQTVNYLKLEGAKDFRCPKNHTQIPVELITGEKQAAYRIYFSHTDETLIEELNSRLEEHRFYYPPYFGSAPFQCYIDKVDYREISMVEPVEVVPVCSVIGIPYVVENSLKLGTTPIRLEREIMPRSITGERYLSETMPYIYESSGNPIYIKVKQPLLKVNDRVYVSYL